MLETVRIYNVGDRVWYAHYDMVQVKKTCLVCFGEKTVTLVLGNGDSVVLPCDYCGKGFDDPRGYTVEYEYVAKAEHSIITKVQSETDTTGEERRYYFGGRYADIRDLFDTEKEALARCAEKIKQHELEETTTAHGLKNNHLKSYAWNAGYHLQSARRHRKDAEYHEQKAVLCKDRVRTGG